MTRVPTARDGLSEWYFTLDPTTDVYDAIEALLRRRASCAPVIDEAGELIGILTEKDCMRVLANSAYDELARGTVADYMSRSPMTIDVHTDVFTVAKQFVATNFTALPVTEDGHLIGRINRQDVLLMIQRLHSGVQAEKVKGDEELRKMQHPSSIEEFQNVIGSQRPEHVAALLSRRHSGFDS